MVSDGDASGRLDRIPEGALASPVTGVGLQPGNLGDQIGDGLCLLVFLRHFGCIFCREMVGDIRAAVDADPDYPSVLFFFQGSPTEGRAFLRRDFPQARAVSDPDLALYEAFGVRRASLLEGIGPSVLRSRGRAAAKGHVNGPRTGDIWRMPGVFAVEGDRILWAHTPAHAADHPDFTALPSMIRAARSRD